MLSVACVFAVSIAMPTTLRHASQDSCQTTTNTCHPCNKNCAVLNKTFTSSPADCCEQCSKTAGCASWTYTLNGAASLSCHLKCTCASRRWFTIQVACLPPLILPPQHLLFLFLKGRDVRVVFLFFQICHCLLVGNISTRLTS